MPEASCFQPHMNYEWDNMSGYTGTALERRPYYYLIEYVPVSKLVVISAVERKGLLHATDFLRLDRDAFNELKALGDQVFGKSGTEQTVQ